MVRHPKIVQIMALSCLKKSILTVSEYIEGSNLNKLIFADAHEKEALSIKSCEKMNLAKQLCQVVAY